MGGWTSGRTVFVSGQQVKQFDQCSKKYISALMSLRVLLREQMKIPLWVFVTNCTAGLALDVLFTFIIYASNNDGAKSTTRRDTCLRFMEAFISFTLHVFKDGWEGEWIDACSMCVRVLWCSFLRPKNTYRCSLVAGMALVNKTTLYLVNILPGTYQGSLSWRHPEVNKI